MWLALALIIEKEPTLSKGCVNVVCIDLSTSLSGRDEALLLTLKDPKCSLLFP